MRAGADLIKIHATCGASSDEEIKTIETKTYLHHLKSQTPHHKHKNTTAKQNGRQTDLDNRDGGDRSQIIQKGAVANKEKNN